VKNRSGGFIAVRRDAYVKERFKALIAEIGRQFDTDANFEGVAIQESAPSLDQDVLAELDYSPEAYRDALTDVLRSASESMPGSRVFWYMNFLPGRQAYLSQIADAVSGTGVVIGGPDVLPDNKALRKRTYPLYDKLAHQGLVFNSMQNDSYAHEHSSGEFDEKYWDLEQLFFFARDQLHVDYLFWNRKSWRKPADSHNWSEASEVILKHQDFSRN
jgi:hypothetical protein